ncbi:MAG: hypothetical protein SGILL_006555, partial [Bacillariaceae sp.]
MAEVSAKQGFAKASTTMQTSAVSDEEAAWKKDTQKAAALEFAEQYDAAIAAKKEKDHKEKEQDFDLDRFPVREFQLQLPFLSEPIAFNPVVSLIGVGFLW